MSDSTERNAEPELVDRLRVIEAQPLDTRADAYAAVHEDLARRLESAPTDTSTAPRA